MAVHDLVPARRITSVQNTFVLPTTPYHTASLDAIPLCRTHPTPYWAAPTLQVVTLVTTVLTSDHHEDKVNPTRSGRMSPPRLHPVVYLKSWPQNFNLPTSRPMKFIGWVESWAVRSNRPHCQIIIEVRSSLPACIPGLRLLTLPHMHQRTNLQRMFDGIPTSATSTIDDILVLLVTFVPSCREHDITPMICTAACHQSQPSSVRTSPSSPSALVRLSVVYEHLCFKFFLVASFNEPRTVPLCVASLTFSNYSSLHILTSQFRTAVSIDTCTAIAKFFVGFRRIPAIIPNNV